MKPFLPFLPLFVGLAGWFLVAVLVLSTLFAAPRPPRHPLAAEGGSTQVVLQVPDR